MRSLCHYQDRFVQNGTLPKIPELIFPRSKYLGQSNFLEPAKLKEHLLNDSLLNGGRFILFAVGTWKILGFDEPSSTIEEIIGDMNIDLIVKNRQFEFTERFRLRPLLRLFV